MLWGCFKDKQLIIDGNLENLPSLCLEYDLKSFSLHTNRLMIKLHHILLCNIFTIHNKIHTHIHLKTTITNYFAD